MRPTLSTPVRQHLLCGLLLGLLVLCAPFPRLQLVLHAALVLAVAPRPGAPLTTALWCLAAGWVVEGTLRLYPHLGGTPWADLSLGLLAAWMAGRWPPENLKGWLGRLAFLALAHLVAVHGAVRLAAGPHPWGWGWLWVLASLPAWGWASWRLLHREAGAGRL